MRITRLLSCFFGGLIFFTGRIECKRQESTIHVVYQRRPAPFEPKVVDRTCLLLPEEGPCRAHLNMYFFRPDDMSCHVFEWGGCQGNGNRFDSEKHCMDSCVIKKEPLRHKRPSYCSLTFDYGYCFGHLERWHYNKLMHVCEPRVYSGCGGNKNNFHTKEQCNNICLFQTGAIIKETIYQNETILIVNKKTYTPRPISVYTEKPKKNITIH